MKDALFVAGMLFLVFPGMLLWRLPLIRRLDLSARLAIAFAGGVTTVTLLLYVYNFAHVPWTRTTLGVPLIVAGLLGYRVAKPRPATKQPSNRATWTVIFIFVLLTIYGVATARETCGDLIFFWGPKGQHFHYAGSIDAKFLGYNHYYLMHHDYPPLLPLAYAWASLVAHRFSWWGALFLTPIALLAIAAAFRGFAAEAIGEQRAGWYSVLLTAILGYGFAIGMVAGAAEPPLLLFEVIAVAALTFSPGRRDAEILAAIALAAAVMTKVEGAAFAAITVVGYLIVTRRVSSVLVAVPSVIALGSWILFSWRHNLLDSYSRGQSELHLALLGKTASTTLREASYNVIYVPWLAALAPLAFTRRIRRAELPLIVAAGTIASTLFFYLHADDPSFWIEASAQRVLLTPLACLVVASAAASE